MYLRPNDVEVLHMEWTSRCPLFCQQCARTDWEVGKAVMPTLPMGDMKPDFVDKILPQFPNVDVLHVCGNYGDIIAYPYLLETLDIVNKHEIPMTRLYTNGSARTTEYWVQVAKKLKGTMTFSIDGLEDTNHIYRVGSNWKKVMESAKAFIDAGGYAIWEMLVFEHNQHQVEESRAIAKQWGVEEFVVKKSSRFITGHTSEKKESHQGQNRKGKKTQLLKEPSNKELKNPPKKPTKYDRNLKLVDAAQIGNSAFVTESKVVRKCNKCCCKFHCSYTEHKVVDPPLDLLKMANSFENDFPDMFDASFATLEQYEEDLITFLTVNSDCLTDLLGSVHTDLSMGDNFFGGHCTWD